MPEHWLIGYQVPWEAIAIVALLVAAAVAAYGAVMSEHRLRIAIPWSIVGAGFLIVLAPALTGDDYIVTRNLLALWVPFAIGLAVIFADPAIGRAGVGHRRRAVRRGGRPGGLDGGDARRAAPRLQGPRGGARRRRARTGWSSRRPVSARRWRSTSTGPDPAAEDELAATELVVVTPKPTEDYGVGPCWWLSTCGGVDLLPVPAFAPPPGFELERHGETELFDYDVYTAAKPTEIPRPIEFLTPRVFAQPPS